MSKASDTLNLVLLGKSGVGKSSCGNTILGKQVFKIRPPSSSDPVTHKAQIISGVVGGRNVVVIDTPDLFGSQLGQVNLQQQMASIVTQIPPGPCIFLLVLPPAGVDCSFEETLVIIQTAFGEKATDSSIGLVTHGDHKKTAVENLPDAIRMKIHIFDNTDHQDNKQVRELLSKIDGLIENTGGFHLKQILNSPSLQPRSKFLAGQRKELRGKGGLAPDSMDKHEDTSSDFKLNTWLEREKIHEVDCVRLVLIGKTGVGKSATGNTILGKKEFLSSALMGSVTTKCKRKSTVVGSKMVHVIDTPGLFDTSVSNDTIREEIGKCITMSSPGPHVFLLLISVGRFTQEETETVELIKEIFGEYAKAYTIVGFTKGEELNDEGIHIEQYIEKSPPALQELIKHCGGRYHVFCNKERDTQHKQVLSLLEKIDAMILQNGGSFYTTAMFEEIEAKICAREMRLLQQKMEELENANKDSEVSFLISELSKIKLALEKKLKNLHAEALKEQGEDIKELEELQANLERDNNKKIKEIDAKVFAELARTRDSIRRQAEKAEAKAIAKTLQHNESKCSIS